MQGGDVFRTPLRTIWVHVMIGSTHEYESVIFSWCPIVFARGRCLSYPLASHFNWCFVTNSRFDWSYPLFPSYFFLCFAGLDHLFVVVNGAPMMLQQSLLKMVWDYRSNADEEPPFSMRSCTCCWSELFISREALFSSVPDVNHRPSKTIWKEQVESQVASRFHTHPKNKNMFPSTSGGRTPHE